MTNSQLQAMLAESDLDADGFDDLATALSPLDQLADEAPAPSAELLALFGEQPADGATVHELARPAKRSRGRGVVAGAVVLALSGVGATGLSAAANTLPSPFQHQVSDFSRRYLPFNFPQPTVRIPHLAEAPHAQKPLGAEDARRVGEALATHGRDGADDETSRSLPHGRPVVKGASASKRGHAGVVNSDRDSATSGRRASRPRDAGDYPSPSAFPSASPSAAPSGSGSPSAQPSPQGSRGPKPAVSFPVKTVSPSKLPPVAGPRGQADPEEGKYHLHDGDEPKQGDVPSGEEVPRVGSDDRPDSWTDDSGSRDTGPVLDKAAPNGGSSADGDADGN